MDQKNIENIKQPDPTENQEQTRLEKWLYSAIDAMFRMSDEMVYWWKIGKITMLVKDLQNKQYALNKRLAAKDVTKEEAQAIQIKLEQINDKLSSYHAEEALARRECFKYTPSLLFGILVVLFIFGIIHLSPPSNLLPLKNIETANFGGQVSKIGDQAFSGHNIITSAKWFNNNLYVGGDGGLIIVDTNTSVATGSTELPQDFFVRDLVIDNDRMLIAGFSGVYMLKNSIISNCFPDEELPEKLINTVAPSYKNSLLIGTVGKGLLRSLPQKITYSLGTKNRIIKAFGRQGNELWLMCEDEILTGKGDSFKPLNLQILAGRKLLCMETTNKVVYLGTDQGVIAGYRNNRNQIWTTLSAGRPGYINDIVVTSDILFIGSDEGVFRFHNGRMDRLSAVPCNALAICGGSLAAISKNTIMMFEFSPISMGTNILPVPEIGTYTPALPIMTSLPQTRLQYGRLPDFGLLETDNKTPLVQSTATETVWMPENKPFVELPAELQRPIFSDALKGGKQHLLATVNRGVWAYSNNTWSSIKGAEKQGLASLCSLEDDFYAYGDSVGVYRIELLEDEQARNENEVIEAKLVIKEEDTVDLVGMTVGAAKELYLLYKDGRIVRFKDGQQRRLTSVPKELSADYAAIHRLGERFLVVTDKGILTYAAGESWNLVYFKGSTENARIAATEPGVAANLYVALSDGRVFEYKNDELNFVGVVTDQPVAMNYSSFLWIAGKESLFFLENNSFVQTPLHGDDKIIAAFPTEDNASILVFTGSGVKILSDS
jgi:hypothetical protein